jgi:hypothetical protein
MAMKGYDMKSKMIYNICELAGRCSGETPEQIFVEQRNMEFGGLERAVSILKDDQSSAGVMARALYPCLEIIEID